MSPLPNSLPIVLSIRSLITSSILVTTHKMPIATLSQYRPPYANLISFHMIYNNICYHKAL